MKLKPHRLKQLSKLNPLPFAFLIPFLGMLAVMLVQRCEPFGNNYAFLYSDEFHQYYPFFLEFRRALLRGDSLLYSWNAGMGMDYLGLIAYYLASPLNLLSVFVPEGLVLEYFAMLSPIRLGLAGLFFAIFLKKIFHKNDMSIAIFGGFYGLCAWALGFQWNVMWLDTFALLPLVALGTVYLLRDKKYILYTVTLFLSIFSNYYIGLFTCIFVLLLFICYQICRWTSFKRFLLDLFRIALFSALAIGMTAILELPAYMALQNTYSSINAFPDRFCLSVVEDYDAAQAAWDAFIAATGSDAGFFSIVGKWFVAMWKSFPPILDGMAQVAGNMSGELSPTFMKGLPNIACGLGPMVLAILFLTAKDIKVRDKLCCVGLLVFFILSFLIKQLDYIWHGFHFTNMIPYRFSFLYSFVMLYMAYRAWLQRDSFKPWQLAVAFGASFFFVFCSEKADDVIFIIYNVVFLLLYLILFVYAIVDQMLSRADDTEESAELLEKRRLFTRRLKALGLCAFMCLELAMTLGKFGLAFSRTSITNYPKGTDAAESMISYMKEREKYSDFYRAETTHAQILNDAALNDYYGVSTFTSSANVRVSTFLEAMGHAAYPSYNRYCYEITSPVADLFLNLKYLIERDGEPAPNPYYNTIHSYENVYLMENKYYLPLGFLAESSLEKATMDYLLESKDAQDEDNEFIKQNKIFSLATGLDEDVWTLLSGHTANITGYDVTLDKVIKNSETAYAKYHTGDKAGTIRYSYSMQRSGFLCMEMNMTKENTYRVYLNGKELFEETISLPQVAAIAQVEVGDLVELEIVCKSDIPADEPGVLNIRSALLNDELFRQGYEILSASTLDLTHFSNTLVQGKINCNRDGLLYTSIPYDGNWVAEVDGKEADVVLVGDAMMALNLTEGTHTVSFRYHNKAFTYGAIISAVSLTTFLCIVFIPIIVKKRKK